MIAIAVGQTMTKYMHALLDPIFACGLSDALTQALVDMAHYIPPARQIIQEKLLDLLSTVLCGRPFQTLGSPNANSVSPSFIRDYREGQTAEHTEAEIALALQTLGSFDFSGKLNSIFEEEGGTGAAAGATPSTGFTTQVHNEIDGSPSFMLIKWLVNALAIIYPTSLYYHYISIEAFNTHSNIDPFATKYIHNLTETGYVLNEFVHDVAVQYVEHDSPTIRKAATLTCCQLFVKDPIVHQVSRHAVQIVSDVIGKLLAVAVADPGWSHKSDNTSPLSTLLILPQIRRSATLFSSHLIPDSIAISQRPTISEVCFWH